MSPIGSMCGIAAARAGPRWRSIVNAVSKLLVKLPWLIHKRHVARLRSGTRDVSQLGKQESAMAAKKAKKKTAKKATKKTAKKTAKKARRK
ncbi:MAG TPA: hypothetical protein VF342_00550 [Alphaproteobacteria bacterium]